MLKYNTKDYFPQYTAIWYENNLVYGHECNAEDWDFLDKDTDDFYEGGVPLESEVVKYVYEIKKELQLTAPSTGGNSTILLTIKRKRYVSNELKETKTLVSEIRKHAFSKTYSTEDVTYEDTFTYIDT